MVPIIEREIVKKRRWITSEEFIDLLAVAQATPGVLAVNISIFVGYKLGKIRGSIITTLGAVMPSFIIILLIAIFFRDIKDNAVVESIFRGIRPAVVALIAVPTYNLALSAGMNRFTIFIPIVSVVLICVYGFSPIWIIAAAIVGGLSYGVFLYNKNKSL